MLDNKFFRKIAAEVVKEYRKYIFDPAGGGKGAKQVDGKPYPNYSKKGENIGWRTIGEGKKTRSVFIDSYANRKKTGNIKVGQKPQHQKFKDSKAPVLTGDLLNDYQFVKYLINGFSFGFPTQGAKVKQLAKMGRVISKENKALPDSVAKYLMDQADKYVKKELKKIKGGTFNIG